MGGTYIFFLHPKWSKLYTVPLMGPKNPPTKKKLKQNIFDLLFGPFKKVIFCSFYTFPGGTFFIQNVANFAQPLLWILRTPQF